MKKKTKVYVGMDVHKDSVMIAVLPEGAREPTLVHRTELLSRQPGRPGGRGSPESDRQRSEAPPCAATPRSSGGAPGDPQHG